MLINESILSAIEEHVKGLGVDPDVALEVRRVISLEVASRQAGLVNKASEELFATLQSSLDEWQYVQIIEIVVFTVTTAAIRSHRGCTELELKNRIVQILANNYHLEQASTLATIIIDLSLPTDVEQRALLKRRYKEVLKKSTLSVSYQLAAKHFIEFLETFCRATWLSQEQGSTQ